MNSIYEFFLNSNFLVIGFSYFFLLILFLIGAFFSCSLILIGSNKSVSWKIKNISGALIIGFFLFKAHSVFLQLREYSQNELIDLELSPDMNLYSVKPKLSLGNKISLDNPEHVKLGKINCHELSFKECISEIKDNKEKIVSDLSKSSESYVVNR